MNEKIQISINSQWCKKCGLCSYTCPKKVYSVKSYGSPEIINIEKCSGCGLCVQICPDLAIDIEGGYNG